MRRSGLILFDFGRPGAAVGSWRPTGHVAQNHRECLGLSNPESRRQLGHLKWIREHGWRLPYSLHGPIAETLRALFYNDSYLLRIGPKGTERPQEQADQNAE